MGIGRISSREMTWSDVYFIEIALAEWRTRVLVENSIAEAWKHEKGVLGWEGRIK